uniref:CTLH domain-containing protein n=1 Tax=Romanomermis culicivorax TaxID=13658 RepID=A0A915HFZ1_ROMCU
IAIERETGIINGFFSSDCLFLRQLIVDGSWDVALDFVEPLKNLPDFNYRQFKYLILKYKYFELLCIKNEPGCLNNNEFTVEELVECLHSLENVCPSLEDYRWLCALLTLPRLADDVKFASWNPSLARIECFNLIFPLVQKFLAEYNVSQSSTCQSSTKDRLLQLVVRGLLYENCMLLCQSRAIKKPYDSFQTNILVDPPQPLDPNVDGSLFSWLKAVPAESFTLPFSRQILDVRVDKIKKPSLEAAWTEQILATPLKPDVFPYNVTPVSRLKSTQKMSLSMIPQYESSNRDKNDRIDPRFIGSRKNLAALTTPDRNSRFLSQSIAVGFQLGAGNFNLMQQSAIDVLLETSPDTRSSSKAPPPASSFSDSAKSNVAVVAPSARHSRGSVSPEEDDIDLGYEEGNELRRQHASRDSTPTPARSEISTPVKRPMSARQHLDDLTRKTSAGENRSSLGSDALKSQHDSPASSVNLPSGKLYEEFNKNRKTSRTMTDQISSTNPSNINNNVAYQLMQMSLYSSKNSSSGYGCQDVIPEGEIAQISSVVRRRTQDSDGTSGRGRTDSKSYLHTVTVTIEL